MNTIIPWLEHLNVLMPPRNIALVGAGNGKGTWAQWLAHQASKSRVTLIEAEPLQYSTLQRTLGLLGERAQHCEIRNTVVAAQQGTVSFFVANSQQESGLLEPLSLLSLWPNLQTQEVRELSAITLDALLSDLSEDTEQPMGQEGHWLLIDCLPAGALLRASSKLDLVDVVIARVLLGERHAVPDGTSLQEVAELLQQQGMPQIVVEATRHPGIGYALFVRDARAALHVHHSECQKLRLNGEEQAKLLLEFQAQVGQLTQTKAAAEKRSQELALQLEQLGKACDEQAKLAQERHAQIEQLIRAKADVDRQSQERSQQLEQLTKARNEQAKLAQERHAQIEQLTRAKADVDKQSQERSQQLEQLTKARDEQAKLAQERHAQIEQLTQAKAAAEKQSQERSQQLEQLGKARDEQTKLAQQRHAQIEQLTQVKTAAEKQLQERAQQLEQLAKAHDEQAKLAQERQVQIEQQAQVNVTLEKQAREHAKKADQLGKAQDEQAKLAQDRQTEIEKLTQAKTAAEKQIQEHEFQLRLDQENKEKVFDKIRKSLFLSLAKAAYTEKFLTNSTKNERNEKFSGEFIEFEEENISHTSFLYSGIDFFFIHAKNDYIPRVMAEQASFYETPFLETLASLYKPGSTIVDCGANIGNHSVFFAKVLGADVISFEPQPFNHIILMANILLNNCQSNVFLIEKGAGEKRDVLSLHMAVEDNYGSFTTEKKFIKTKSNDPSILKTFDISIEKMDDEIRFLEKEISIIKIDVEGMELSVLKGAREIIKNNFPAIAAECFTKSMFDKVKDFLSEFGYFAFDSKNATPTFIFLCKNNEFHNQIVRDFFEKSSLNKYENKKSFVEK